MASFHGLCRVRFSLVLAENKDFTHNGEQVACCDAISLPLVVISFYFIFAFFKRFTLKEKIYIQAKIQLHNTDENKAEKAAKDLKRNINGTIRAWLLASHARKVGSSEVQIVAPLPCMQSCFAQMSFSFLWP